MTTRRRDFLGWLGVSAASAVAGSALTPRTAAAAPAPGRDSLAPLPDNKWDMSWVDKVTGKHRAVFDSVEVDEGVGLFRACVWRDQYAEIYGTSKSEMTPVLVIRHASIPLAMNDEYWKRFNVGKTAKIKDSATNKWTTVNPIRVAGPRATGKWADYNLTSFMAQGGIVLACDLALRRVIADFVKADKLKPAEARAKAIAHVIPGIVMMPSGVFAVLRAQEAGCGYILASEA